MILTPRVPFLNQILKMLIIKVICQNSIILMSLMLVKSLMVLTIIILEMTPCRAPFGVKPIIFIVIIRPNGLLNDCNV